MLDAAYNFKAKIWVYSGKSAWFFVTLPRDVSDEIKFFAGGSKRPGWGSVRVTAKIGKTEWKTSIFPDAKRGAYLLPVKSAVRKAEKIAEDDQVSVTICVHSPC